MMMKRCYRGIDPNDGELSVFVIQGRQVARFFASYTPSKCDPMGSYWLAEQCMAELVVEAIPTFELLWEVEVSDER